jgi:hypothetical protein
MNRCLSVLVGVLSMSVATGLAAQDPGKPKPTDSRLIALSTHMKLMSQVELVDAQREEVADRNGYGPELPAHDLSSVEIDQFDEFYGVDLRQLCRYSLEVYRDGNHDSGIFYFRPQSFALKFEPPDYYLSVEYGAATEDGNNVIIQAALTPGGDRTDRRVLEALLKSYLKARGGTVSNPILLPLPVTYEASFQLQDWHIEEVTVNGVDPDTGEIQITLSADVPTKELVTSTLGNINGLTGNVELQPIVINPDYQNLVRLQPLVARIRLPDAIGGPAPRWRPPSSGSQAEYTNPWPFDMRLRYLAYLIEEPDGGLRLGGWSLGDAVLGPGDTARVSTLQLNQELDSDRVVTALYLADLVRDDRAVREVVDACTGGVGGLPMKQITVEALDPGALFDQYNIHKMVVEIRSAHFDPEGRQVETRTYDLDGSEEQLTTDPLHLWEDSGDLYQYRVVVITSDGVVHGDRGWRSPHSYLPDQIMIGSALVEEVLAE